MILECYRCDLCTTRRNIINSTGLDIANISIILESPTYKEDKLNITLTDSRFNILKALIETSSIPIGNMYITYAVKCKSTEAVTNVNISNCREHLFDELNNHNNKFNIVMGNVAYKAIFDNSNYNESNKGSIIVYRNNIYLYTHGLNSIVHTVNKRKEFYLHLQQLFKLYNIYDRK